MAKKKSSLANAGIIRRILKEEGFSEYGIRGALARMRQESSLNPKALRKNDAGPGRHSHGILQWNDGKRNIPGKPGRLAQLKAFAARRGTSPEDVETQARFFAHEAKTTEAQWGKKLINARSDDEAARMAISMARPQGWTAKNPTGGHGWKNTINWTKNWAAQQRGESTEFFGQPELDPAIRESQKQDYAGKALGRIKEEREFSPEMLTELDRVLYADPTVQENMPEIDNSPGAIARQTMLGFFQAIGAGAASADANTPEAPELGSQKKQILAPAQESPGVSQILGLIRGMV